MIFLIFGTHPVLSLAEAAAVLGKQHDYARATPELLVMEKPDEFTLEQLQDRLSGVIKMGNIIGEMGEVNVAEIADLISAFVPYRDTGKVSFGISVYEGGDRKRTENLKKNLQTIGLETKRRIKESGRTVRYVSSKQAALSAVIVTENHLLESGGEFALIGTEDGVFVGQTETVQDYKAWSKRDYGRPGRDPKSGMLPPKLARLMVNLSGTNPSTSALLDPFCGSGTILMEAALLGFQKIIGSDISDKAIKDSRKNIVWLGLDQEKIALHVADAKALDTILADPVDTIVTETYLGPPSAGRQTPAAWQRTITELLDLYRQSFHTLHRILKPGGTAVVAFPAFMRNDRAEFLPIRTKLEQIGFKIQNPLPAHLPAELAQFTPSGGLLYRRPDAHVAREIIIMSRP